MRRTWAAFWFIVIIVALVGFLHSQIYPDTSQQMEGFMPRTVEISGRRCGVDLPSCAEGEHCLNGYCASDAPPIIPLETDLPIRPPVFSPEPWGSMNIPLGGHNESRN